MSMMYKVSKAEFYGHNFKTVAYFSSFKKAINFLKELGELEAFYFKPTKNYGFNYKWIKDRFPTLKEVRDSYSFVYLRFKGEFGEYCIRPLELK